MPRLQHALCQLAGRVPQRCGPLPTRRLRREPSAGTNERAQCVSGLSHPLLLTAPLRPETGDQEEPVIGLCAPLSQLPGSDRLCFLLFVLFFWFFSRHTRVVLLFV